MALFDIPATALHAGVSQQPEPVRHPNQVESAVNVRTSVVNGSSRRPGTRFLMSINGLIEAGNYRFHPIDRDENEQYLVVFGEGVLRVFDLAGNEAAVTFTADAEAYFMANSATADQIRLVTSFDTTFIVNTTVATSADGTVLQYTVTDSWTDYDVMVSQLPAADSEYHRAIAADATGSFPLGFYQYNVDGENGFATWTRGAVHNASWDQPLSFWSAAGINPLGVRIRFQRLAFTGQSGRDYDWQNAAHASARSVGETGSAMFASYTFEAGDEISVTGNATLPSGYYPIISKLDDDFVEIDPAGASATVGALQSETPVTATDADSNDNITVNGITRAYSAKVDFSAAPQGTMEKVALSLQNAIRNDGAGTDPGQKDIIIQYLETGRFKIVSPWRGAGSRILAFYRTLDGADNAQSADQSTDPFWFASGTAVDGTGTPTDRTQEIVTRWFQVPAPGSATSTLDATTMPITLTRTGTTPLAFLAEVYDWTPRLSGDETSNPLPEPILEGDSVNDIAVYKDRLWLLMDNAVLSSQAGDLGNLFLDDPANLIDSDPINTLLPGDAVARGEFFVQHRQTLNVFAKNGSQFHMNRPDVLTRDSIRFTAGARFTTQTVRPQTLGQRLYFVAMGREGGSRLMEDFFTDVEVSLAASDVSKHVPTFLGPSIRNIVVAANEDAVIVLPTDGDELHFYQSYWEGPEKKQTSWVTDEFDATYRIADIAAMRGECYLLVESGTRDVDRFIIEAMKIEAGGGAQYAAISQTVIPVNIGVFASPRVNTAWQWNDGSQADDVRAYLEGLFTINWVELPDPITAASLADLQLVILTTNQAAAGAAGATDPLVVSEQESLRDWIRGGGCYIAVLENPDQASANLTNDALCFQGLSGDDDLAFTFDGVPTGTITSATSTFNTALPIIDGAHGTVTSIGYTNPASIQTSDPRASVTGTIAASGSLAAGNLIAYFPPGAYGPTAGAIMLACDSQMFWDADLAGDHLSASSLALLGNFIAANVQTVTQTVETPVSLPEPVHLDRTMVLTGVFNSPNTEWTLPAKDATLDAIVLGPDFGANAGDVLTPLGNTGNVVSIAGNYTTGEVLIGRQFESEIELTRPYARRRDNSEILDGFMQYKSVVASHRNTRTYTLTATLPQRADRARTFAATETEETGIFRANLQGDVSKQRIFISSVGAEPFIINSVEYEVGFVQRN